MDDELVELLDQVEAVAKPGQATIKGGIDARGVLAAFLIMSRDLLRATRVLVGLRSSPPAHSRTVRPNAVRLHGLPSA